MIVDGIYKKFNVNKLNRSGGNNSSQEGTVYLGTGNKSSVNIGSLNPHYLWGQLFDGTQDIDGDITSNGDITGVNGFFQNLTVTGAAHFYELIIDKIKSVGGAVILSPADGFEILDIDEVEVSGVDCVKLWFLAEDGDNKINNMWEVDDQLLIMDFNNASAGYSQNAGNRYFWGIVNSVSSTPENVTIGEDVVSCHYVTLNSTTYDGTMPDSSYVGASCVQLGNRSDSTRQGAIYLSAYSGLDTGITAPFIAIYDGINDFNLTNHRQTWFSMNGSSVKGELHVYDNANEKVDISPTTLGILDNYTFENFNQTVIGVDGMFSGNSDKYFWNGQDGIATKYSSSSTLDYEVQINSDGITRTQVKDGEIHKAGGVRIVRTDISTTMPVVTISARVKNTDGDPIDIDKNAGFVVCTYSSGNNDNPIKVRLPELYDCVGKIIYIKPYSTCFVYAPANEYIVPAGDGLADKVQNKSIDNDMTAFLCDGTYWYEHKGV